METKILTDTAKGEKMVINIRLSDPCNNGHNDFAITANIYEGRKLVSCGCQHQEILKVRPDLKIFVDLHLSNEEGMPMYAIENGFYHMNHSSLTVFANYMRIPTEEAKRVLTKVTNKEQFTMWIGTQAKRYKSEAKAAKQLLKQLSH